MLARVKFQDINRCYASATFFGIRDNITMLRLILFFSRSSSSEFCGDLCLGIECSGMLSEILSDCAESN